MPLYEYQCESCGVRFEAIQKFTDAPLDTCRTCGGKVQRLLSAPAIHFKGSGWYVTDYARKGSGSEAPSSSPGGATGSSSQPTLPASSADGGSPKPAASSDSASSSTPSTDKK